MVPGRAVRCSRRCPEGVVEGRGGRTWSGGSFASGGLVMAFWRQEKGACQPLAET